MKLSGRILVIDDDASFGRAIRRILNVFDVTTCSTLDAARSRLLIENFDVVVSDVQLGQDSGLDLFEELVIRRPELAARYVFISGAAGEPETRARLVRTGVPFLSKPFKVGEFTEAIAWILAQRYAMAPRKE